MLRCMRYKHRMMGAPITDLSYIYGGYMLVVHNTSRPELVLRKKSYSVCYHTVCESLAMEKSLVGNIHSKNFTDLMTKVL